MQENLLRYKGDTMIIISGSMIVQVIDSTIKEYQSGAQINSDESDGPQLGSWACNPVQ